MTSMRSFAMVWIILGMLVYHLWQPLPCQAVVFADLQGHWGKAQVEQMAAQRIVAGYPDGNFYPDQPISRAEFTVFISRAVVDYPVSSANEYGSFTDVKPEDWFYPDILRLTRAGIIKGEGNGLFHPQRPVQRQEAAQMLWTCMLMQGFTSGFEDCTAFHYSDEQNISGWAQTAVKVLTRLKVFCGCPDQCFYPTHPMTRAEACLALKQITILLKSQDKSLPVTQQGVLLPRPQTSSSGGSRLPASPNAPGGLTSNYLHCRVRVIN